MADEKKSDTTDNKDRQSTEERPENAATSYGLEDHEATAMDPRVNELRMARSQHGRRLSKTSKTSKSLTASPSTITHHPANPELVSPNAATNYGLEGYKATKADPRIINMQTPKRSPPTTQQPPQPPQLEEPQNLVVFKPSKEARTPVDTPAKSLQKLPSQAANSSQPPQTASSSQPPQAANASQPPQTPLPPPPPQPPLAARLPPVQSKPSTVRTAEQEKSQVREKKMVISKFTNTDVSFDPSKEFATKTTNTSGKLYADDEDERSAPEPAPPPQVKATSTKLDLDEAYVFAVALVRKAGAYALTANKTRLSFTTKEHERDLNTRVDMEIEAMIVNAITEKYPDHKIIAEEAVSNSATGQVTLSSLPTWIIDPIDGTMNFVHHFPYYCISVALLIDKETAFGIVFNPPLQEFYVARKGTGAQLNDMPMHTTNQESLRGAMILQEYSSGMNESRTSASMENTKRLIQKTHALRSIGSSAMGLAMVASGVADAFYFFGLHVWDMAAGNILVTEAGGTVIDPSGGEVDIMSRRVLAAATKPLALALSTNLVQNYPKPRDDEPRSPAEPLTKDFNAQTDFTDSSSSFDSDVSRMSKYHNVS
ncbi:uncharacterized protein LOC6556427 [Drosophila grimshawi]|uniref:inositol-phosphate phosphatase n=1 Tax=Drosophila grimshawi TaxID=7222 RepID=B4J129_DROGR|nr:uncharacterized protein LOC6556427 [Drosophila grimshawi]EDV96884.1 GH16521 [Drosophila grimshawi]